MRPILRPIRVLAFDSPKLGSFAVAKLPQPPCSDILGVCPEQNFSGRSAWLDAEAHISAQPPEAEQNPRVSYPYEDQVRAGVLARRRAKGRKRVSVKPGFRE